MKLEGQMERTQTGGTCNVQNRPLLYTVHRAHVIILEEKLSLLLSIPPLRMTWLEGRGQAAHLDSSPASRLLWHINIDAILGTSVDLSPQNLVIHTAMSTQVGNLLLLTITREGLWPTYSKGVSTEYLRDQSQLVVLTWMLAVWQLLCRTTTSWPSPHQGVPKQPYPIHPKVM